MTFHNDEYLLSRIETASPYQLHKMVVDAAVRNVRFAAQEWESGDFDRVLDALSKSRECVAELMDGIREEAAPELASRQRALFAFTYQQLVLADVERDRERVTNALRILEIHQETWNLLGEKLAGSNAGNTPAPAHFSSNRPVRQSMHDDHDEPRSSGFSLWT